MSPRRNSSLEFVNKTKYGELIKIWTRETGRQEQDYRKMFVFVLSYLSRESQNHVKDNENWPTKSRDQDMEFLVTRIRDTHRTGDARIPALALNVAKKNSSPYARANQNFYLTSNFASTRPYLSIRP